MGTMRVFHIVLLFLVVCALRVVTDSTTKPNRIYCRDPDLGGQLPDDFNGIRRYLVVHGLGAGIGNFLVYFPAAYWFAAFTGRDITVLDHSLIGEMCKVVHCGFPLYSQVRAISPHLPSRPEEMGSGKQFNFQQHIGGETPLEDEVVIAHGYKYMTGWYMGYPDAVKCLVKLSGCNEEDWACHDRHAMQRLVRGPFTEAFTQANEDRLVGVPMTMRHGILTLPHSYSPRFHVGIHLRCQFQNFESLIGPGDGAYWDNAVKERDEWLNHTDRNKGYGLFKIIEDKLVEDLAFIRSVASRQVINHRRNLEESAPINDAEVLKEAYDVAARTKIHVFISSDNEEVKEALARYLMDHEHIEVMRVKNKGIIVHAKNVEYLKNNANNTGVADLVLDWYCLTLSNVIYGWRRDTSLLSTFAQSAQRLSGNSEQSNYSAPIGHGYGTLGRQLYFDRNLWPVWRNFY